MRSPKNLEQTVRLLYSPDILKDSLKIGIGNAFDGRHVTVGPMVGTDAVFWCDEEGAVAMVARVIDPMNEGRSLVCARRVFAMT